MYKHIANCGYVPAPPKVPVVEMEELGRVALDCYTGTRYKECWPVDERNYPIYKRFKDFWIVVPVYEEGSSTVIGYNVGIY